MSRRPSGATSRGFGSRASASPRYRRDFAPAWACVPPLAPAGRGVRRGSRHDDRRARGGRRSRRGPGTTAAGAASGVRRDRVRRAARSPAGGRRLIDPATARLYSDHGGVCLPHFLRDCLRAGRSAVRPLADRFRRSLASSPTTRGSLRSSRVRPRRQPPGPLARSADRPRRRGADGERLCGRLGIEACPVCLRPGWASAGTSSGSIAHAARRIGRSGTIPGRTRAHLHDLALADRALAAQAIEHKRAATTVKLSRLLARVGDAPDTTRRGRGSARQELDTALQEILTRPYCPACNARRNRALPARSRGCRARATCGARPLRTEPRTVRSACAADFRRPGGRPGTSPRRRASRSAGVGGRGDRWKYAWAYRHEADGHEQRRVATSRRADRWPGVRGRLSAHRPATIRIARDDRHVATLGLRRSRRAPAESSTRSSGPSWGSGQRSSWRCARCWRTATC